MGDLKLFNNTSSKVLVAGQKSTQPIDPRTLPLFAGDTINLTLYYLQTPVGFNPQDIQNNILQTLPTTGLTPFVALTDGTLNGTVYASGSGFAADATFTFFTGVMSMNTGPMTGVVTSANGFPMWLYIGYIQGGLPFTTFRQQVTVYPGIPIGAPVPVPGLTALSVEVARQLFYPIAGQAGLPLRLISPLGKEIDMAAIDNGDGSARLEAENAN